MNNSRRLQAYEWTGQKPANRSMVRLLDLLGFQEFEDRLQRATFEQVLHSDGDDLSKQTFGLTYADTLLWEYEQHDSLSATDRKDYERVLAKHEARFRTANVDDVARVEILATLGLDFTDCIGRPLKCTRLFCRQAEMAVRNGWKPQRALADTELWGSQLEKEAKLFASRKRQGNRR